MLWLCVLLPPRSAGRKDGRETERGQGMRQLVHVIVVALALVVRAGVAHASNDTLVWDIAAGPQYVDPVMGTTAQANVMVLQNVYERLVWYDGPGTQPIPWLASGWGGKKGGGGRGFQLRKGGKV